MSERLQDFFRQSVAHDGNATALVVPGGETISYASLASRVKKIASFLSGKKTGKGCRVAVMLPKSIDTVAVLLAVLETGAAYIPFDVTLPPQRIEQLLSDIAPHVFISTPGNFPAAYSASREEHSSLFGENPIAFLPAEKHEADLAFILYTSGSTGIPKGVCITHENAIAFVKWSLSVFSPLHSDRFSSVAPFHFDLSVFDLYTGFASGGAIVLFADETTRNARLFAQLLSTEKISILYATPSQLNLLLHFGKIEKNDYPSLRLVLFAGEVFPVVHLHALVKLWSNARFFNLYGPTETNVCTWYEIPRRIDVSRSEPYPIGKICAQLEGKLTRENELLISGPNVSPGYWKRDELNEKHFTAEDGKRFYHTGDRVEKDVTGNLVYAGRIDRMIKKRGYRIEPGEVESVLQQYPGVVETAVVAGEDEDGFSLLRAFIVTRPGIKFNAHSVKMHCAERMPAYMIPEKIIFIDRLPKTSSGKTDYFQLISHK